jgi:hypothetical protein
MQLGKIYRLDGHLFRCIKIYDFGACRFQKVNADGSDMEVEIRKAFIVDHMKRTILKRLPEMVEIKDF